MTDEDRSTDPHPIGKSSLFERMSDIARENGGHPTPIEAARAHLGTAEDSSRSASVTRGESDHVFTHGGTDAPRGSVEDAMIAGADLETGELPPLETETIRAIVEAAPLAGPVTIPPAATSMSAEMEPAMEAESAPPPAAQIASDVKEVASEPAPQPAAPSPPPPERHTFNSAPPPPGAAKQEIIEPERAADGTPAPFAARDAGTLVNMLENGQLSAEVIAAMTALTQGMSEIAEATGKRQKGTLTIKINLSTDDTGEAFFVQGEFAVRAPKVERRKTLLWPDEKGHLSPSQPRQRVFFGVKDVGGGPRQIRDATAERRPL